MFGVENFQNVQEISEQGKVESKGKEEKRGKDLFIFF